MVLFFSLIWGFLSLFLLCLEDNISPSPSPSSTSYHPLGPNGGGNSNTLEALGREPTRWLACDNYWAMGRNAGEGEGEADIKVINGHGTGEADIMDMGPGPRPGPKKDAVPTAVGALSGPISMMAEHMGIKGNHT